MDIQLRNTYDRIAKDWHRHHQTDSWWKSEMKLATDLFISKLFTGAVVLDAGCGSGGKAQYLLQNGLKIIGIDFSKGQIKVARLAAPQIDFRVNAIEDIPLMKEHFDGVYAEALLLHYAKKHVCKTIENLISRLKNDGLLYISVKQINSGQPEEMIVKENRYGHSFERFFSFYRKDEIRNLIESVGPTIVDCKIAKDKGNDWIQIIAQKH